MVAAVSQPHRVELHLLDLESRSCCVWYVLPLGSWHRMRDSELPRQTRGWRASILRDAMISPAGVCEQICSSSFDCDLAVRFPTNREQTFQQRTQIVLDSCICGTCVRRLARTCRFFATEPNLRTGCSSTYSLPWNRVTPSGKLPHRCVTLCGLANTLWLQEGKDQEGNLWGLVQPQSVYRAWVTRTPAYQ